MSIINNVLSKVLGSHNDRLIKKYNSQVNKINSLEEHMKSLSDSDLSSMTEKLKARLKENESVESVLPEAFAVLERQAREHWALDTMMFSLLAAWFLMRAVFQRWELVKARHLLQHFQPT